MKRFALALALLAALGASASSASAATSPHPRVGWSAPTAKSPHRLGHRSARIRPGARHANPRLGWRAAY
jgi:ABC-type sugar transport system substrate-binding protein